MTHTGRRAERTWDIAGDLWSPWSGLTPHQQALDYATTQAHRNSNGLFVTLSEPICRKVILGCPFTITYLLLIGTEVIDLLYARVPKYHFDLPFLPCATYLLDPNYLNSSVPYVLG